MVKPAEPDAQAADVNEAIADLRVEYRRPPLHEADAGPDPILLFQRWLEEAADAGIREANAMTLATATPDGRPSARMVLLKEVDDRGFCFFTNYESRKGRELAANARAALVLWWEAISRQVRIEGMVEQLSAAESDAYFDSRPRGARLGAWASQQSRVIPDRGVLEQRLHALEETYAGQYPPRPAYWGGYRVVPTVIEFWQGGANRLHDRLRYTRQADGALEVGAPLALSVRGDKVQSRVANASATSIISGSIRPWSSYVHQAANTAWAAPQAAIRSGSASSVSARMATRRAIRGARALAPCRRGPGCAAARRVS